MRSRSSAFTQAPVSAHTASRIHVVVSVAQPVPSGTLNTVLFDSAFGDTLGEYSSGDGCVRPRAPGLYRMSAALLYASYAWPATGRFELLLCKNEIIQFASLHILPAAVSDFFQIHVEGLLKAVPGDTLSVKTRHPLGSTADIHADYRYTRWDIDRLDD